MTALTCPDCGQTYAPNVGHCRGGRYGGCCSSFDSNHTGDAHRTGPFDARRCLTADERRALGWYQTDRGYWRSPKDDKQAERIRQHRLRNAPSEVGISPQSHGNPEVDLRDHPAPETAPSATRTTAGGQP